MKKSTKHLSSRGFSAAQFVLILAVVASIGLIGWVVYARSQKSQTIDLTTKTSQQPAKQTASSSAKLDPADFTTEITNKYLTLRPGQTMTYQQEGSDNETVKINIETTTKKIAGIPVLIHHDRSYVNGVIEEDTMDYLAQRKSTGDVWYFGEDVDYYEHGKLKSHEGTFHHGENGAQAGIYIKAEQNVGDTYRQEYDPGKAEDTVTVVATNQTVKIKKGTYTGCVKFYAWNPLEKDAKEYKYNCPEVGIEVLTEDLVDHSRTELTELTR